MTLTPTIKYDGDGKITIVQTVIEETTGIDIYDHLASLQEQYKSVDKVYQEMEIRKNFIADQISDVQKIIDDNELTVPSSDADTAIPGVELDAIERNIVEDITGGIKNSTIMSKYEKEAIAGLANKLGIDVNMQESEEVTIEHLRTHFEQSNEEAEVISEG